MIFVIKVQELRHTDSWKNQTNQEKFVEGIKNSPTMITEEYLS